MLSSLATGTPTYHFGLGGLARMLATKQPAACGRDGCGGKNLNLGHVRTKESYR